MEVQLVGTSTVTYTRHLEEKVAELQALLRQQPATEDDEERTEFRRSQEQARDDLIDTLTGPEDDHVFATSTTGSSTYHGRFAGLSVLRMVRDLCTEVAGAPMVPSDLSGDALAEAFDSTMLDLPAYDRMASLALLPSRPKLERTIAIALDNALNCKECIDRADLKQQIQTLYDRDPEDYSQHDRQSLALVYALLALGRRHEPVFMDDSLATGPQRMVVRGATYFRASRSILDTLDSQGLDSVRTTIVLACYMLSSPMLSKAYTYVCTGVGIALRLGLHVSSPSLRSMFSPKELIERRQVFSVLYLMDTYISSTLGVPKILRDADLEQTIPAPEDEMHDLGKGLVARDPMSPASDTIRAAKLFHIQAKITQQYSPSGKAAIAEGGKHGEPYQGITDREAELQEWHKELPDMPSTNVDPRVLRTQLLLRLYYTCVRISLYRPFLHHVIRKNQDPDFNYRGYACGSACIESSMQAVWLVDTFDQHGYLHEAQWFNIFLLALAATSLMLFVLGTREGPTVDESRAAALKAQELLGKLGQRNASARRCYDSLAALPQAFEEGQTPRGAAVVAAAAASGVSPRSQFLMGIGALQLPREPSHRSEGEETSTSSMS